MGTGKLSNVMSRFALSSFVQKMYSEVGDLYGESSKCDSFLYPRKVLLVGGV